MQIKGLFLNNKENIFNKKNICLVKAKKQAKNIIITTINITM